MLKCKIAFKVLINSSICILGIFHMLPINYEDDYYYNTTNTTPFQKHINSLKSYKCEDTIIAYRDN